MREIILDDFSSGRNTLDAVNLVKPNQSGDQENCWVENKALIKRRGTTNQRIQCGTGLIDLIPHQLKPTAMATNGLLRLALIGYRTTAERFLFYTENGTSFSFAGYTDGTVSTAGSSTTLTGVGTLWLTHVAANDYFIHPSTGALNKIVSVNSDTDITLTSAVNIVGATAYTIAPIIADTVIAAMEFFDVSSVQNLFIAEGTRAYRYTGTTMYRTDNANSMPAFKFMVAFKNYLFGMGHNNTDIRWCALKDATTWSSNNFQTVTTQADRPRGVIVYGDSIVIFTRRRMWRFLGDTFDPANPTYRLEEIPVPPNFNFNFSRSAVVFQGRLVFFTADGWHEYDGNIVKKLSDIIQTDVDAFTRFAFDNETVYNGAVAFVHKNRMWCSIGDNNETPQDVNNTVYLLDENRKWWKWPMATNDPGGRISDFAICKFGTTGSYNLVGGNHGQSYLATLDTGSSDDASGFNYGINAYWISKEFVFNADVDLIEAEVTMKKQSAGNLTFSVSIDRATFIDFTCAMNAGTGTVIRKKIPIGRVGKSIRFKVANSTASQPFEIYEIRCTYENSDAERV